MGKMLYVVCPQTFIYFYVRVIFFSSSQVKRTERAKASTQGKNDSEKGGKIIKNFVFPQPHPVALWLVHILHG